MSARSQSLSEKNDFVIHVCISLDFSCCYQNAKLAAADFDNVYVVDSRNLSTGHGLVVLEAERMAREGMEPDDIVAALHDLTGRVEASFILDRLDYMKKGGRCSAVTLLGANLLKLRPCIEVKDGKMGVGKKYRGSFEQMRLRVYHRQNWKPQRSGTAPRVHHALRRVGRNGAKGCGNCAKVTAV